MDVIAPQLLKSRLTPEEPAPVGVVAALPGEIKTLRRAAALWNGVGPRLALSGMGPKAAFAAADALARAGAAGLVSFGYVGALKPGLGSGTLILPGSILTVYGGHEQTDSGWAESLLTALDGSVTVAIGPLLSTDRMITGADEKRQLHAATGALAVDMESMAIAAAARRHGIGFLAVRVVLDEATHALPGAVTAALDVGGRVQLGRLARALVARPGDIAGLIALAGASRAADRTLLTVCRLGGPRLGLVA